MDLNEYQKQALRTAAHLMRKTDIDFGVVALGVAGEAGEVADYVKKVIGHGHKMDKDKLIKELGDVMWYVAVMASMLDVPLSDVAVTNIAKLKARYPDGWDKERSINRKENVRHLGHSDVVGPMSGASDDD